jgi:hypothetical protein
MTSLSTSVRSGPWAFVALCLCATGTELYAQRVVPSPQADSAVGGRTVQVVELQTTTPVIDGKLDDGAWTEARPISGFVQRSPRPGQPAMEATDVRMLYTKDALYVAARLYDSAPDSIAATLFRRDTDGYSDWFSVQLDVNRDRRTALGFEVSPRGIKRDLVIYNDGQEDRSWNAVWDAAARIDSLGWTVEMRIPVSQLRFTSQGGDQLWGVNFRRETARRGEVAYWSPTPPDASGIVARFGQILGLRDLPQPRRLEVQPYASSRLDRKPFDGGNPLYKANDLHASVGGDVRYDVTSKLTLDATLNPDFGQVEVDPAVVNLSAFETFYPERRPFFIEGTDVLHFGTTRTSIAYNVPELFYSRRIGQQPTVVPGGDGYRFVDAPGQTTIAGAGKLTGKLGRGWSVGILDAVTTPERASFLDSAEHRSSIGVAPLTNYFVGRLRHDAEGGRTRLGVYGTGLLRKIDTDLIGDAVHSRAFVAGTDIEHEFAGRDWVISGYLTGSAVVGRPEALAATQRSSSRYFQRPDAAYLDYDPSRGSLRGYSGQATLSKVGGKHWRGSISYQEVSPGFEVNDVGFQSRADMRGVTGAVAYQENEPKRFFRDYGIFAYGLNTWNFGGDRLLNSVNVSGGGTLKNFWYVNAGVGYDFQSFNDRLTRGGPLAVYPAHRYATLNVSTDGRKRYGFTTNLALTTTAEGSWSRTIGLSTDVRPSSALTVSVGPQLSRVFSHAQYITSVGDETATATYGRRYIFGNLSQTSLSLATRVNWTFSPDLTLQLYLQPLVVSADYGEYKEFSRPRSYAFAVYGRDQGSLVPDGSGGVVVDPDGPGPSQPFALGNQDFNFRSMRGNAVLRWEYRRGSTLFLVWQQDRSGVAGIGDFDLTRDSRALFGTRAENVLLVKLSYWLGY